MEREFVSESMLESKLRMFKTELEREQRERENKLKSERTARLHTLYDILLGVMIGFILCLFLAAFLHKDEDTIQNAQTSAQNTQIKEQK